MTDNIIWQPTPEQISNSHLAAFARMLQGRDESFPAGNPPEFAAIHRWSVEHPASFWAAAWQYAGVIADSRLDGSHWDEVVAGGNLMQPPDCGGPHWFTGARLNFAENLLRPSGAEQALVSWDEDGRRSSLSREQLRDEVAACAAALQSLGVESGDRVAGWLPNGPHAIIAMLATAAIGAVWTSCSPDFGVDGVVDRFGQTAPKVLFFCDGYRYNGKLNDCVTRAEELLQRLPSVKSAVQVHWHGSGVPADHRVRSWETLVEAYRGAPLRFTRLPFNHPLYILYSSGTTGLPKCMVHGAGGTLLQHLKEHQFHTDLHQGERLFYFTTCGWMMWNWLVSGLATGVTLILYDGAPMPMRNVGFLWRLAAEEKVNVFGTSARYLAMAEKSRITPDCPPLPDLRLILSTGSPLTPASFDWVASSFESRVQLSSISGGTDIVSCFVLGNPFSPVLRGQIQGAGLGMAVEVYTPDGRACPDGVAGELVCTRPFPAMPVQFWNDSDARRYKHAYFERFPGAWHHGDWITRTPAGGFVITGRSDATLNPGGIRIGTAEIYRQVEGIPEVVESLAIGQRRTGQESEVRVVLFVRLQDGVSLDGELEREIRKRIREGASPHHVPKVILAVTDIPRTRSGKLSELAVRAVVEGRVVENLAALANPEALEQFRNRSELKN